MMKYWRKNEYGFFGNFTSWEKARRQTSGYDSAELLEKTRTAAIKVRNGEAVYERDSVLFDTIEYSWPLLSALMWIAAKNHGILNVVDFGGSLGTTYFQNRLFFNDLNIKWNVVEQQHVVSCGKRELANKSLHFYDTIEECLEEQSPMVVLLAGVLQYLPDPWTFLSTILGYNFCYVLFDRTTFIKEGKDRLTIQRVTPKIYRASFPCWFFDENRFRKIVEQQYNMVAEFISLGGRIEIDNHFRGMYKGFIFQRR
jgi:putative methyltransferase (TIGR04325 family)